MGLVARLFGTPAAIIPSSLAEFRDYFESQLVGETITVTAPARQVAAIILEDPNVEAVSSSTGFARLTVRLKPASQRKLTADQVIARLRRATANGSMPTA